MSMETYVLSDRRLASVEAWQEAVDLAGLPLRMSQATPFSELQGALPVVLKRRATAFECDHCDAKELMAELSEVAFDRPWTFALAFRWGADVYAGASAYAASWLVTAAIDAAVASASCASCSFRAASR